LFFEISEKTKYFNTGFVSYNANLQPILNKILEEKTFFVFSETREL
jgi:hypothetical protein